MSSINILFMQTGPMMPDITGKIKTKYDYFSLFASGFIVTPVAKDEKYLQIDRIGKFDIFSFYYYSGNPIIRNLIYAIRVFIAVAKYTRENNINFVVSPNPLFCGLIALLIRSFTGAKVIVEVNGNFEAAFTVEERKNISLWARAKYKISMILIPFVLRRADKIKLVYSHQLGPLGMKDPLPIVAFPNFVPIESFLKAEKSDKGYVLLLGYPWYLKGVDVLIKAFQIISPQFPQLRLKIVGWCPEGYDYFEDLANGNPNIELSEPVHYEKVIPLVANCSVYVLASRTDSSPRVIREAMACKKPIVASAIDGVPELIEDGVNGLLFEKENVQELAEKLLTVLTDKDFAQELAINAYHHVQEKLSEKRYMEKYQSMIAAM